MSKSYLVLSAVGPDRPGLVDVLSDYVFQRGGNVEESRMARLGGEFAIIMLVSGPPAAVDAVENDVEKLVHGARLMCQVKPTSPPTEAPAAGLAVPYDLTVYSMDHPGIVRAVAHHLAERKVNIDSLDTLIESAPHTGTAIFRLKARLSVPAETNIPRFRGELDSLAAGLNVDIHLAPGE